MMGRRRIRVGPWAFKRHQLVIAALSMIVLAAQCLAILWGIRIGKQWIEMMGSGLSAVAMVGVLISLLLAARSEGDIDAGS